MYSLTHEENSIQGEHFLQLLTAWAINRPVDRNESLKNRKKKKEIYSRWTRLFGEREFSIVNIRWYLDILKKKGCHPNPKQSRPWVSGALITEIQTFRAFIKWMFINQYIPFDFGLQIDKPKAIQESKDILSSEVAERVVESSNEVLPTDNKIEIVRKQERKLYLEMLLWTPTRKSELKSVTGKDLKFDVPTPYMVLIRKGGKSDKVVIPKKFIEILKKRVTWKYVFPANPDGVANSWKQALLKNGINEDIPLHRFRHMRVTEGMDAGANPADMKELMAHEDMNVTLNIYKQHSVKKKIETLELFDPLWRRDAAPEKTIEYIQFHLKQSGVDSHASFRVIKSGWVGDKFAFEVEKISHKK